MRPLLASIALLLAAAPPKPPARADGWTVELHDDVDSSALELACQRVGPTQLRCVDLQWILKERDAQREHDEQIEERKEEQRKAWNCHAFDNKRGGSFAQCGRTDFDL